MPQAAYWTGSKRSKVWLFVYLSAYTLEWGLNPDCIDCIGLDWEEFKPNCQSNPIRAIQSRFFYTTLDWGGVAPP